MKKFLIIFVVLILSISVNSYAGQEGDVAGIGNLGLAVPTGDFGDKANTGFGVHFYGMYYVIDNLAINVGLGYYRWSGDIDSDITNYDINYWNIPVHVGGIYEIRIPRQAFMFYAGLDLGLNFFTAEIDYESEFLEEGSDSETDFSLMPKIGVFYPFSKNLSFDGNIKINVLDERNHVIIGVGVKYFFDLDMN